MIIYADKQATRIQQLELRQALCGIVSYPNEVTYNAGCSPFMRGNCGCNSKKGYYMLQAHSKTVTVSSGVDSLYSLLWIVILV